MYQKKLSTTPAAHLALWGGIECTVNRIGDNYYDQLERSGHAQRLSDLDRIAELGIRTLRYPILWERVAPHKPDEFEWEWSDERLHRLRKLGIRPIVGLLHHGSGPHYTSLTDPQFPEKFAHYARAVAEHYPWVDAYMPINEPLTTARFSCLYGHWYPHEKNDLSFARTLVRQCRAVALAMRAIRTVNDTAQLIQNEDVGCTFSTPMLDYQAEFQNERRWLSFDLLLGRVDRHHPLSGYLHSVGLRDGELQALLDAPCAPDILGLDYYVNSDRFLDERIGLYPSKTPGGNGLDQYVDVAAVGVRPQGIAGLRAVLHEVWQRYHLPLAVTEVHMGAVPEEQIRWLAEMWNDAQAARHDGVNVCAVTAWALLGSYDWDSLHTRHTDHYEAGAYAICNDKLQTTEMTNVVRMLACEGEIEHPALRSPGWWHRPERLLHKQGVP